MQTTAKRLQLRPRRRRRNRAPFEVGRPRYSQFFRCRAARHGCVADTNLGEPAIGIAGWHTPGTSCGVRRPRQAGQMSVASSPGDRTGCGWGGIDVADLSCALKRRCANGLAAPSLLLLSPMVLSGRSSFAARMFALPNRSRRLHLKWTTRMQQRWRPAPWSGAAPGSRRRHRLRSNDRRDDHKELPSPTTGCLVHELSPQCMPVVDASTRWRNAGSIDGLEFVTPCEDQHRPGSFDEMVSITSVRTYRPSHAVRSSFLTRGA